MTEEILIVETGILKDSPFSEPYKLVMRRITKDCGLVEYVVSHWSERLGYYWSGQYESPQKAWYVFDRKFKDNMMRYW